MISIIFSCLYLLTIIVVITMIFVERRSVQSTIAWTILLTIFPIGGLVIYVFFGRKIFKTVKIRLKKNEDNALKNNFNYISSRCTSPETLLPVVNHLDMVEMLNSLDLPTFTYGNKVDIYTSSNNFFQELKDSLMAAKKSINIQFYIFRDDHIGSEIISILEEKQKSGVRVKLLYDAMGSRTLNPKSFNKLISYGGKVASFFPSKLKLININMNYRNHRKIVVIDGGLDDFSDENLNPVAFVGGFNIGDEYLGRNSHFGNWRDTHIKVYGPAVKFLNLRFLLDWRFATKETMDFSSYIEKEIKPKGDVAMQIIASGPDLEDEEIKYGYIKMVHDAKDYIYIQSPYLILDVSLLEAIKMACYRGIDVRIMIPGKADHPFVFWANRSYAGELLKVGAKIYTYSEDSFLHSKTVVIDDEVCSIGTANMDIRSFALNFEVNAFIYSTDVSVKQKNAFLNDILVCDELTLEKYERRSTFTRVKESISRLLSPIL